MDDAEDDAEDADADEEEMDRGECTSPIGTWTERFLADGCGYLSFPISDMVKDEPIALLLPLPLLQPTDPPPAAGTDEKPSVLKGVEGVCQEETGVPVGVLRACICVCICVCCSICCCSFKRWRETVSEPMVGPVPSMLMWSACISTWEARIEGRSLSGDMYTEEDEEGGAGDVERDRARGLAGDEDKDAAVDADKGACVCACACTCACVCADEGDEAFCCARLPIVC